MSVWYVKSQQSNSEQVRLILRYQSVCLGSGWKRQSFGVCKHTQTELCVFVCGHVIRAVYEGSDNKNKGHTRKARSVTQILSVREPNLSDITNWGQESVSVALKTKSGHIGTRLSKHSDQKQHGVKTMQRWLEPVASDMKHDSGNPVWLTDLWMWRLLRHRFHNSGKLSRRQVLYLSTQPLPSNSL